MRAALRQLTRRGRVFLALGAVGVLVSAMLGQRDLLRIGILLVALPLLSALLVARTRYKLASARGLRPTRVTVDQATTSVVRVENVSRLPSGLLLVEDAVPWQLGRAQRFVLDRLEAGGRRDVRYELRGGLRGRYTIGPVSVQLVDPFGLCRATRQFTTTDTLTVVPAVVPLPAIPLGGDWSGLGEARARAVSSAGEDDVIPREYRTGDELRRVHWKSTARSGASSWCAARSSRGARHGLRDTRAVAHRGHGAGSSFSGTVSAAASAACHLARRGYAVRVVNSDGEWLDPTTQDGLAAQTEGPLLDTFAIVDHGERGAEGQGRRGQVAGARRPARRGARRPRHRARRGGRGAAPRPRQRPGAGARPMLRGPPAPPTTSAPAPGLPRRCSPRPGGASRSATRAPTSRTPGAPSPAPVSRPGAPDDLHPRAARRHGRPGPLRRRAGTGAARIRAVGRNPGRPWQSASRCCWHRCPSRRCSPTAAGSAPRSWSSWP
ncbi:MAG: DUF58 domain-containing protein [Candidatus Nanopelagicales bacterium]